MIDAWFEVTCSGPAFLYVINLSYLRKLLWNFMSCQTKKAHSGAGNLLHKCHIQRFLHFMNPGRGLRLGGVMEIVMHWGTVRAFPKLNNMFAYATMFILLRANLRLVKRLLLQKALSGHCLRKKFVWVEALWFALFDRVIACTWLLSPFLFINNANKGFVLSRPLSGHNSHLKWTLQNILLFGLLSVPSTQVHVYYCHEMNENSSVIQTREKLHLPV